MTHPLALGVFDTAAAAGAAARALHAIGVPHDRISVLARNHDEEGALAGQMDATPGTEVEDSRRAGRLGELSGYVLAAIAIVMPGIGPIVAAGPLAAGLGEAAGHVAGGVASRLSRAGVPEDRAEALQDEVDRGAILLGAHVTPSQLEAVRAALADNHARQIDVVNWAGQQ
ncbi:MAG TPA: hypothetical protein VFX12_01605 [Vicinamibacterales bacterium]|nr:hypothetical protein [Vicinamibacterales bacterium]